MISNAGKKVERRERRKIPDGIFITDGATGSELDRRGVDVNLPLWCANANLVAPEEVKDVHREYFLNGAKAVTANTFRTNERTLAVTGLGHLAKSLTKTAVEAATAARDEIDPEGLVLGSVGPVAPCYRAELCPDDATLRKEHRMHMTNLLDAGVDFIWIETLNSAREGLIAAEIAQELAPGHWGISFSLPTETIGIIRCGTPLADIVGKLKKAVFIGINCMDGRTITEQVKHLKTIVPKNVRIAAYGNIGFWVPPKEYIAGVKQKNSWENDTIYVKCVKEWIDAGASIVGGCCGTTPELIRMILPII